MKYLYDDVLAQLSSKLMDCPIYDNASCNSRVLHGRIEAYTTKRTHQDKRHAVHLLERCVADQESNEQQQQQQQQQLAVGVMRHNNNDDTTHHTTNKRRRSQSTSEAVGTEEILERPARGSRLVRSFSLDESTHTKPMRNTATRRVASASLTTTAATTTPPPWLHQPSRRLWTDLILTLNLSFPDFDFDTKSQFTAVPLRTAVAAINQRIGDNAMLRLNFWPAIDTVVTLSQISLVYSYIDSDDILTSKLLPEHSKQKVIWSVNYFFVNKNAKRIVFFTCIETMLQPVELQRNSFFQEEDGGSSIMANHNSNNNNNNNNMEDNNSNDEDNSESVNFDMDPSSSCAGGIPIGSW